MSREKRKIVITRTLYLTPTPPNDRMRIRVKSGSVHHELYLQENGTISHAEVGTPMHKGFSAKFARRLACELHRMANELEDDQNPEPELAFSYRGGAA